MVRHLIYIDICFDNLVKSLEEITLEFVSVKKGISKIGE